MPWFDIWSDGGGNVLELFYVPTGATYDITNARAINASPNDLELTVTTTNPDGSPGAVKLDLRFPSGSTRNAPQAIQTGTFAITPQGNPGSGSFTWDDAVQVRPVLSSALPPRPGGA